MSKLFVTVVYKEPGQAPAITSSVVPIDHHLTMEKAADRIYAQYRHHNYYKVTVTGIQE